jgi:hypothetical protein
MSQSSKLIADLEKTGLRFYVVIYVYARIALHQNGDMSYC